MSMFRIAVFIITFLGLALSSSLSAQTILRGRVIDEVTQKPLPYASVYFNSTTNGVTTDLDGGFEITVDSNFLELVVSFLGYKPLLFKLDYDDVSRRYAFMLPPLAQEIQEVEITAERSERWYDNLRHFTEMFIGNSTLARHTKILNPEVLYFSYDEKIRVFEAMARGPIKISNERLGYEIEYALVHFAHNYESTRVTFLGYPRYKEQDGKKRQIKRWDKRREEAYLGSATHFMQAMYDGNLVEEGFRINKIVREPNPNRPSEEQIAAAREVVRRVGYNDNLPDSTRSILNRSREEKFLDYLDMNPHPYEDDLSRSDNGVILAFEDIRQVIYDNEKEDQYYTPPGKLFNRNRIAGKQTSTIIMTADSVQILSNGLLKDPLAVLYEGYWAFEKVADMLPLDYKPREE